MSEENKQISSLFKNNTKDMDQSTCTVEVEVSIFLYIHEAEGDSVFLKTDANIYRASLSQ